VRDDALLAELATPVPPFSSGHRMRTKLAPGTKHELRAHLERVRRAIEPVGPIATWRMPLRPPLDVGDRQLDAFVVEHQAGTDHLDFRLEIGDGLSILWALPAARDDRLRLVHVDGAAYELEEPELVLDPWSADLAPLVWEGELAHIDASRTLVRVAFTMASAPARYRCDIRIRHADGRLVDHTFAWLSEARR